MQRVDIFNPKVETPWEKLITDANKEYVDARQELNAAYRQLHERIFIYFDAKKEHQVEHKNMSSNNFCQQCLQAEEEWFNKLKDEQRFCNHRIKENYQLRQWGGAWHVYFLLLDIKKRIEDCYQVLAKEAKEIEAWVASEGDIEKTREDLADLNLVLKVILNFEATSIPARLKSTVAKVQEDLKERGMVNASNVDLIKDAYGNFLQKHNRLPFVELEEKSKDKNGLYTACKLIAIPSLEEITRAKSDDLRKRADNIKNERLKNFMLLATQYVEEKARFEQKGKKDKSSAAYCEEFNTPEVQAHLNKLSRPHLEGVIKEAESIGKSYQENRAKLEHKKQTAYEVIHRHQADLKREADELKRKFEIKVELDPKKIEWWQKQCESQKNDVQKLHENRKHLLKSYDNIQQEFKDNVQSPKERCDKELISAIHAAENAQLALKKQLDAAKEDMAKKVLETMQQDMLTSISQAVLKKASFWHGQLSFWNKLKPFTANKVDNQEVPEGISQMAEVLRDEKKSVIGKLTEIQTIAESRAAISNWHGRRNEDTTGAFYRLLRDTKFKQYTEHSVGSLQASLLRICKEERADNSPPSVTRSSSVSKSSLERKN